MRRMKKDDPMMDIYTTKRKKLGISTRVSVTIAPSKKIRLEKNQIYQHPIHPNYHHSQPRYIIHAKSPKLCSMHSVDLTVGTGGSICYGKMVSSLFFPFHITSPSSFFSHQVLLHSSSICWTFRLSCVVWNGNWEMGNRW